MLLEIPNTQTFLPGVEPSGVLSLPTGTTFLAAMVGIRLPSLQAINLSVQCGSYSMITAGSDCREEFKSGRFWQVEFLYLPNQIINEIWLNEDESTVETIDIDLEGISNFGLTASGQHLGIAVQFAAFSSKGCKGSFSLSIGAESKPLATFHAGEPSPDWLMCAATDISGNPPQFSVIASGGTKG